MKYSGYRTVGGRLPSQLCVCGGSTGCVTASIDRYEEYSSSPAAISLVLTKPTVLNLRREREERERLIESDTKL